MDSGLGKQGPVTRDLRKNYSIIIAVACLAMAAISMILLRSHRSLEGIVSGQFAEQQALTARQTAQGIEGKIDRMVRELELLARNTAIIDLEQAKAPRIMEETLDHVRDLYINDIGRVDADGIVRYTVSSPELVGKDFSFRSYFKEIRRREEYLPAFEFITFQGFRKGEKGTIIAMPVFATDGAFAGPVLFVVEIGKLLRNQLPASGNGGRSWAVDGDGIVMHHPSFPPGTALGTESGLDSSFATFLADMTEGKAHRGRYLTGIGEEVIATSHPVAIGGETWFVVTETDGRRLGNTLRSANIEHYLGMILSLLAVLLSALYIVRLLGRGSLELQAEIAERRAAEESLRLSEETHRTLIDNSPS